MTPAASHAATHADTVQVHEIRLEHSTEATVATLTPRLSWKVTTARPAWAQAQAEIECSTTHGTQRRLLATAESVLLAWPFDALPAGTSASLRLRVQGHDGDWSAWSAPRPVHTPVDDLGLHEAMITIAQPQDEPCVHQYRRGIHLPDGIVEARLTITARGIYQAEINGTPIGDEHLAPGWTAYDERLLFQTHLVTQHLRPGWNHLGVWVAPGWFGEQYGFFGRTSRGYTGPLGLCARLQVRLADGSQLVIGTDDTWQGRSTGHPVLQASIYHGETHDARLAQADWARHDVPGEHWQQARAVACSPAILQASPMPPVRTIERRAPLRIFTSASGKRLADFGENIVGVCALSCSGPAGHRLALRHAEDLDEHGEPAYDSLRTARATDVYVLSAQAGQSWHPRFTFHGFRYVEIEGWTDEIELNLQALVWQTDMALTGGFACSHPLVNQLIANALRSLRGNFVALPTDCPQRDERLGWTGDLQVFLPAASGMLDVAGPVSSWLEDLALEQHKLDGIVPVIVPAILPGHAECVAGWGDVAVMAPWALYQRYGDVQVLQRQFPSMAAWINAVLKGVGPSGLWDRGMQIGDHLSPQRSAWFPGSTPPDKVLLASAFLARSAHLTAQAAALIGREDDARHFQAIADRTREAICREYITANGRIVSDAITAYALMIHFELVDAGTATRMGQRLAELIAELDHRIGTGFLGTPLIMDALADTGQLGTASRLLTQTRCPSWLYPVTMGATSIWESWDLRRADGTLSRHELGSANHYALGAVTDFLQRRLAGLAPAEPGYRRIAVRPLFLDGFSTAQAWVETPYGRASVSWQRDGDAVQLTLLVPPNARATVHLPGQMPQDVPSGQHSWAVSVPQAVPAPLAPVSMHSPLEQVAEDAAARDIIVAALLAHDPHRAPAFQGAMAWQKGVPLHGPLMFVHPDALRAIELGFGQLNQGRARV